MYRKRLGPAPEPDFSFYQRDHYNPSTDPYSAASTGAGGKWNTELQNTSTSVIGEANYDIGHLFGATGGGGNAGCIGCVCTNGSKGSGYTSPADGPQAATILISTMWYMKWAIIGCQP